jgi:hypothetical protein
MKFCRWTVWEDLTPEQMVERYAAGAAVDDLAILAGIGSAKVRKILVERGVTIRPSGYRKRRNKTT